MNLDWRAFNSELKPKLNEVRDDLRSSASQFSERSTGRLVKGFRGSIRNTYGDPDALTWKTQRHAYILNHGIEPGTESSRSGSGFTYTQGLRKSDFITKAVDRHLDGIADVVAKFAADITVNQALAERIR